jgi:DNA-binding IclR family transcriptional regulator
MTERATRMARSALARREQAEVDRGLPATPRVRPRTPVGVLDRSFAIVDAVEAGARTFTAIVEATGIPRTTAHRMIDALERHGVLFHVGGLGYALGPRLLGLAATAIRELPLRQLARPALERLARVTAESAQLYVRDGDRRVCVDAVESDRELRTIVEIGAALPLDRGSAGTVLRACALDHDPGDGLHLIRSRGWAQSHEERERGVASVSAPVFGPAGMLLAAVSVSGPVTRIRPGTAKEFAPAVLAAAREIGGALGSDQS